MNIKHLIEDAICEIIRNHSRSNTFGIAFVGLPNRCDLRYILEAVKRDMPGIFISLIGYPGDESDVIAFARSIGFDEHEFGVGATHAVDVRNQADSSLLKVIFAWSEEPRLGSVLKRGYVQVSSSDIIREICLAASKVAPNDPQKSLWLALSSEKVHCYFAVEDLVDYCTKVFQDARDDMDAPRRYIYLLGLLKDSRLLTGPYSRPQAIIRRIQQNAEVVERLQRADDDDREVVYKALRSSSDIDRDYGARLYNAFLRIARGDDTALGDLTLDEALGLLHGKIVADSTKQSVEHEEDGGNDLTAPTPESDLEQVLDPNEDHSDDDSDTSDESRGRGGNVKVSWIDYDTLSEAVIRLISCGYEEEAQELVSKFEQLEGDETQMFVTSADLRIRVTVPADRTPASIARLISSDNVAGGILSVPNVSFEEAYRQCTNYRQYIQPFDDVQILIFLDYLKKARGVDPEFEGDDLIREYLEVRRNLIPHIEMLSICPLELLLAFPDVRETVTKAVELYQRVLSHFKARYFNIRQASREGAAYIYRTLLNLDILRIQADGEYGALMSPINPLVMWRYTEIARIILQKKESLTETDINMLVQEVLEMPEPLLAIHAFFDDSGEARELGYAKRTGSLPVYRDMTIHTTNLSEKGLVQACVKLAALYPMVRNHLKVMIVDPVDLRPIARAFRALAAYKHPFLNFTLIVFRADDGGYTGIDGILDQLFYENRLTIEEHIYSRPDEIARYLRRHPVHIIGIPGRLKSHVDRIDSEGTLLHPLCIPHKLIADPIMGRVALIPRSIKPEDETRSHPFWTYHEIVAEFGGTTMTELTLSRSSEQTTNLDTREFVDHCIFLICGGVELRDDSAVLRLTKHIDTMGDSVYTKHKHRVIDGMTSLLTRLNYKPSSGGVMSLIRLLEENAGDGIFSTISDTSENGFSDRALQGQLGLAVALKWYKESTSNERMVTLSLDSPLARRWLGSRTNSSRTDLLGFRERRDGSLCLDIIEVKSYQATNDEGVENSHAYEQLRETAHVLLNMLRHQGDILEDSRRELLRSQLYHEALADDSNIDGAWVSSLNDLIDGTIPVEVNLLLVELAFDKNIEKEEKTFEIRIDEESLNLIRVRFGERDIQKYLTDIVSGVSAQTVDEEQDTSDAEQPDRDDDLTASGDQIVVNAHATSLMSDTAVVPGHQSQGSNVANNVLDLGFAPNEQEKNYIIEMAHRIYRVLQDIGVGLAAPVDPDLADVGPAVVRYKLKLTTGEKVATVQNRSRDLMRELAINKEPMIDNLPGTNYIYIDVPRVRRQPARLLPYLSQCEQSGTADKPDQLAVPIGVTPAGEVEWLDILSLPHMLVAGSTGSGKTVFLYTLIISLVKLYSHQDVELVLVDPKETDFVFFNNLRHVRNGTVLTDPQEAVQVLLELLTHELESRTVRLRETYSRDIRSYNRRFPDNTIRPIVVVIDEFADLADTMGGRREEFDTALRRLSQRARNVGIHLVVSTQRPTTDIVNGTLKSNLPCRVSFRLASAIDSRTILDQGGAQNLLGEGDMLISWNGDLKRLQGFYCSEDEILQILEPLRVR